MLSQPQTDLRCALEVVLYLAQKSKDSTFHHIFKLLYFADRLHLARYGRLICGDQYIAMKDGPVPSDLYDMFKAVRGGYDYNRLPEVTEAISVAPNGYTIIPQRRANLEWLSDSDIECLDESLRDYDHFSFPELSRRSHDDAWKSADRNNAIPFQSLATDVDDKMELDGTLIEYLADPIP